MTTYHVYAIVNSKTGDAYVGCTTQLKVRWSQHVVRLSQKNHPCHDLQKAWDTYGLDPLQFVVLSVLEGATKAEAKATELAAIAKLGTYNTMNADDSGKSFAIRDEMKLIVRDEAWRKNMGEHTKRRWADPELRKSLMNAPNRGKDKYKGMPSAKTPEQHAEHSAQMKALWADPEKRAKLEARRAVRWSDPEAKARQGEKMRAYHAARRAAKLTNTLL